MFCGLDISTARVGISVINKKNEIAYRNYKFLDSQLHRERRKIIVEMVKEMGVESIFCEEVRLYNSTGRGAKFINMDVIKRLLMILSSLIDAGITVYTMNVISWKTRILKWNGYSITKEGAQEFIKDRYNIFVNDDIADSICQSIYAKYYNDMCIEFF